MKNLGLLTAGVLGAAVLTTGLSYALRNDDDDRAPREIAELSDGELSRADVSEARREGISEREMEARIADERAAADARVADAEARAQAKIACEKRRQEASNTGAVVGGVTGAVIGSQVAGSGAKSEGGVIGGLAGVMVGRDIAKKDHRC